MNNFFDFEPQVKEEKTDEFFNRKPATQENIIPPIGIAHPDLVESFMENMQDEDKIKQDIKEVEDYWREKPSETVEREIKSHGARVLEGLGGSVSSFLDLMNAMTSGEIYEDEYGIPKPFNEVQISKFPKTSDFRGITKQHTGKKLEPKNPYEKVSQEYAEDVGSQIPIPALSWFEKLLYPAAGQGFKQLLKSEGASERTQELGKLGFMLFSGIARNGNAQRAAGQSLRNAEHMIPQGTRFSAQPIENALNNIRQSQWFRTGATPSKAPAMHEIERIQQQIQHGTIDAHTAMQLRRDINEARRQLGGFQLNRPVDRAQALRHLDEVDNALLQGMNSYGNNVNPAWIRQYTLANEAYRVTQRSRLISDFIQQYAKPLKSDTAKMMYGLAGGAAFVKLPFIAAAAVPGAAAGKSVQLMNRMIRSPILRNHYAEVMTHALAGNVQLMNKALQKFDEESLRLDELSKNPRNQKNLQESSSQNNTQ